MFGALKEALAPDVPLVQDLEHHWRCFLEFYDHGGRGDPIKHKSQPVEQTHLTYHLNQILKILMKEREEGKDNLGQCMEMVIQSQFLDILSTLCQADVPPGIRPYIFKLFIFFLQRLKAPLAYVEIFRPLRRILMFCATEKASPTESLEIEFVSALLRRLRAAPELLALFAHDSNPGTGSHFNSQRASRRNSHETKWRQSLDLIEETFVEEYSKDLEGQHLVLLALLNCVDSADSIVASRAMEGVLAVLSLPDGEAAQSILSDSNSASAMIPLSAVFIGRLVNLFEAIPHSDCKVSDLSDLKVNWIEAHHHNYRTASTHPYFLRRIEDRRSDFPGKNQVVSFYAWLDYCDSLIKSAHPVISEYLCYAVKTKFLENCLEVHFGDCMTEDEEGGETDEDAIVVLLAHLGRCWNHIDSQGLAKVFSTWLIGDTEVELNGVYSHPIKHLLIEMCQSSNVEVALETLNLFDALLERPSESILQCLVLGNLTKRGYYNFGLAESQINSWSDEEDEREKNRRASPEHLKKFRFERNKSPPSRTLAPSNIHRIINMWLFLVSEKLESKLSGSSGGSYESYLATASTQFNEIRTRCSTFDWPNEAVFSLDSETSSSDSRPEGDPTRYFYEGEFLFALFSLVQNILNSDQALNLQTTSTLAKLCLLPHPFLHEYLLNPTIPVAPGCRTLYLILSGVCEEASQRIKNVEGFSNKMRLCRKSMTAKGEKKSILSGIPDVEIKLLHGIIVLEEFCKELAAIAFAKYTQSC